MLGRVASGLAPAKSASRIQVDRRGVELLLRSDAVTAGLFGRRSGGDRCADRRHGLSRRLSRHARGGRPGSGAAADAFRRVRDFVRADSIVNVAWVLARMNPAAARALLVGLEPPYAWPENGRAVEMLGRRLQAWAMVDLDQAAIQFHKLLADQGPAATDDSISGLLPMIDTLLSSHEDRINAVLNRHSSAWLEPPDLDD